MTLADRIRAAQAAKQPPKPERPEPLWLRRARASKYGLSKALDPA